jgi:hypothetical protein
LGLCCKLFRRPSCTRLKPQRNPKPLAEEVFAAKADISSGGSPGYWEYPARDDTEPLLHSSFTKPLKQPAKSAAEEASAAGTCESTLSTYDPSTLADAPTVDPSSAPLGQDEPRPTDNGSAGDETLSVSSRGADDMTHSPDSPPNSALEHSSPEVTVSSPCVTDTDEATESGDSGATHLGARKAESPRLAAAWQLYRATWVRILACCPALFGTPPCFFA